MLASHRRIYAIEPEGFWFDIGGREGYLEAQAQLLEEHAKEACEPIWLIGEPSISRGVELRPPVMIADRASIGGGSVVGPYTTIHRGSRISSQTTIQHTCIFEDAIVGRGTMISRSIVGERAMLSDSVTVEDSIIGQGSLIKTCAHLSAECRLWPGIIVEEGRSVKGTIFFTHEKPFYFYEDIGRYTGILASSLETLIEAISIVDVRSLEFHLYRRDFERWIRDVIQTPILAEELRAIRGMMLRGEPLRAALLEIVKNWRKHEIGETTTKQKL